jgi:integrase
VLLLAYTGLRWGEATGLRIRDLDMLRRATISENAVEVGSEIMSEPRRATNCAACRYPTSFCLT